MFCSSLDHLINVCSLAAMPTLGVTLSSRCRHVVVTLASRCRHVVVTLSSSCRHVDVTLASRWRHVGVTLASRWHHVGVTLASRWRHVGVRTHHLVEELLVVDVVDAAGGRRVRHPGTARLWRHRRSLLPTHQPISVTRDHSQHSYLKWQSPRTTTACGPVDWISTRGGTVSLIININAK